MENLNRRNRESPNSINPDLSEENKNSIDVKDVSAKEETNDQKTNFKQASHEKVEKRVKKRGRTEGRKLTFEEGEEVWHTI